MADEDREEEDRQAILRRRARLIGVALSSVVASTSATACACLSVPPGDASAQDAGPDGGMDATAPQPCLSRPAPDAGPPDAAPEDAATDAAAEDAAAEDAAAEDAG